MLEMLLRGMAIGGLLTIGASVARTRPANAAAWSSVLLCVATAAFVAQSSYTELYAMLGPLKAPVWLLAAGGTAYFWLFGMALFGRGRLGPAHALPPAGMTLLALTGLVLPERASVGIDVAHNLLEAVLVLHVLAVIWQGRKDDLVEGRMSLRLPFMVLVALVCLVLSGLELTALLRGEQHWIDLAQWTLLCGVVLLGAPVFTQARTELFTHVQIRRKVPEGELAALSPADRMLMERLAALIEQGDFWRRGGLGIAATAEEIGAPEYRVRQLINRHLGYRNFSDFLNERRIAMAKEELRDPARALTQISAIAFDLGYASLGPFNRAFRDATGMTPREWREAPAA